MLLDKAFQCSSITVLHEYVDASVRNLLWRVLERDEILVRELKHNLGLLLVEVLVLKEVVLVHLLYGELLHDALAVLALGVVDLAIGPASDNFEQAVCLSFVAFEQDDLLRIALFVVTQFFHIIF